MAEKLSLDEHLASQSTNACVATIEPVADAPNLVKLTPWVRNAGCKCELAIRVPKTAIHSVSPTGDVHNCCGKSLRVVAIDFSKDASISLSDVFSQLIQSAQSANGPMPGHLGH